MKRLLALTAIVALLAPAIAVCAGRSSGMRGGHACCPPDEAAATTAPAFADASCCDRSAEAGQRAAVLTVSPAPTQFGAPLALAPAATSVAADLQTSASAWSHFDPPTDSPPTLSPPLPLRI